MSFVLFSARFPSVRYEAKLESPSKEQLAQQFAAFSHCISSNIYNYAPLNYQKLSSFAPECIDLRQALSKYTPSKITELAKPTVTLQLQPPTDESQLKKFKQKQRALGEISICAFLHALYVQIYHQTATNAGNPQKPEVRIASNLPEWQVVKKIDLEKAESKEVFMSLASMYHALHSKYPAFSPTSLQPVSQGRKSYSTLLQNVSTISNDTGFDSEWKAFEAMNAAGFPPIPSTETIGELYPEIKIPQPRGNFGKKKQ